MKAAYGKEPFDFKLTVLRLMVQLPQMLLWMCLSVAVLFGGYCLKNYVFCGPVTYSATSTYRVEYRDEDWSRNLTYINFATWNTYLSSDAFQELLASYMDEELRSLPSEVKRNAFSADVPSDLRVVVITAKSEDKKLAQKLSKSLEEALIAEFPAFCTDVTEVKLLNAEDAEETFRDIRPVRALILSIVVAVIFVSLIFLIKELGSDTIYLPGTFAGRFGVKSLGADRDSALESNLKAVVGEGPAAVLPVNESVDTALIEQALKKGPEGERRVTLLPAITLCPEALEQWKGQGSMILAVPCEKGNNGALVYALELLRVRDMEPAGAVLTDADSWLLDRYYGK